MPNSEPKTSFRLPLPRVARAFRRILRPRCGGESPLTGSNRRPHPYRGTSQATSRNPRRLTFGALASAEFRNQIVERTGGVPLALPIRSRCRSRPRRARSQACRCPSARSGAGLRRRSRRQSCRRERRKRHSVDSSSAGRAHGQRRPRRSPHERARGLCRKTPRDVAVRRAYRRCVRNVSACFTGRQQLSASSQALYASPLTDSNRRPPPYHGGFALRLCGLGKVLASALSLQSGWFLRSFHPCLEGP